VPLGHKLKILKRIKELRKEKGLSVPESRQRGPRTDVAKQERSYEKQDLEAMPEPSTNEIPLPPKKMNALNVK